VLDPDQRNVFIACLVDERIDVRDHCVALVGVCDDAFLYVDDEKCVLGRWASVVMIFLCELSRIVEAPVTSQRQSVSSPRESCETECSRTTPAKRR